MNISMQLALLVTAACLCLSEGAPDVRLTRKQQRPTRGFKNVEMMTARGFGKRDHSTRSARDVSHQHPPERTSRGQPVFKSPSVGIARDFGKRTPDNMEEFEGYSPIWRIYKPRSSLRVANGFGKRDGDETVGEVYGLDNFWETLEASPERDGQEGEEKTFESIPMDWFVNEMLNNPDFTRSVVRKFIDLNQDGVLTSEELLRNVI